jgi:hypothetical protein
MKTGIVMATLSLLSLLSSPQANALEKRDISSNRKALVISNFDEPNIQKKMGVDFGPWELHPSYITDVTVVSPDNEKEKEEYGNVLRVDYNVAIPAEDLPYANYPVFNGVWFDLADADLTEYDTLVFYVKGDAEEGFTSRFKVELKNNDGEIARFYFGGVTSAWQRVEQRLDSIRTNMGGPLKSYKSMSELTIVFEKEEVSNKDGVIYIDNIYFSGPK